MEKELTKRIITSIFLFISSIFCILINETFFILVAIIILFWPTFNEWININKKNLNLSIIGFIYLCFVSFSIYYLRGDSFEDAIFFILILCICAGSDIGGYFFGKIIGGKKLIKISPNKTISGSIGSFIFSLLPIFIFNFQTYINFGLSLKNILFCLIVSLSCQIGDLIISYFKRLNKIKDTGNILPGHGGFLDRIDGLIFAIPTVFILKITQIF